MIVSGVSLCGMPAYAQFNTIVTVQNRYKVETSRTGEDKVKPASESVASEKVRHKIFLRQRHPTTRTGRRGSSVISA